MSLRPRFRWVGLALTAVTILAVPVRAELVVYTAQLIRTMEPALPTATAVAVEEGHIVAVGTETSLTPLIDARNGRIDRQFERDILLPGFIDPHVHPALPAVLTQFPLSRPMTGRYRPASFRVKPLPRATGHDSSNWWRSIPTPACPSLSGVITRCGMEKSGEMTSMTGLATSR